MKKSPYRRILEKLKMTPIVLAEKLKVNHSTVYRWGYDKSLNGTGGKIPFKYHPKIKAMASRRKVKLTAEDFV
jgi:hypothetical protein